MKVPFREVSLTRKNILLRDNNACQYCNYRGSDLSIDHVLPRSRGGTDNWENVTTACLRCNVQKGNRTPDEANMPLKRKPYRPLSNLNFDLNCLTFVSIALPLTSIHALCFKSISFSKFGNLSKLKT